MQSKAKTPAEYLNELAEDRRKAVRELRNAIMKNLPKGFSEVMSYGMLGYVIPHSVYPDGYHCDPKLPLPFMGVASQKDSVNFYHMGLYADEKLMDWFIREYAKQTTAKLDMGKSCVRFKKLDQIPYTLMGELASKINVQQWIDLYEKKFKKK
jgi:uncharacterized protein YdhG (YjbR/CyaY superfamily)